MPPLALDSIWDACDFISVYKLHRQGWLSKRLRTLKPVFGQTHPQTDAPRRIEKLILCICRGARGNGPPSFFEKYGEAYHWRVSPSSLHHAPHFAVCTHTPKIHLHEWVYSGFLEHSLFCKSHPMRSLETLQESMADGRVRLGALKPSLWSNHCNMLDFMSITPVCLPSMHMRRLDAPDAVPPHSGSVPVGDAFKALACHVPHRRSQVLAHRGRS